MRYCTNCGGELGNTQFCTKCGTKVESTYEETNFVNNNTSSHRKANKFIPIIAILVIVAIATSGFYIFGGRSYKSLVKTYVDASMKGDAKKLVSLLPEGRVQYMIDSWYDDEDAIIEDLQEDLDDSLNQVKDILGDDYKVSYNILDERDYEESEFAEFKEDYLNDYNTKISAAKELTVELVVSAKGKESSKNVTFTAVKIGHSWYISGLDV